MIPFGQWVPDQAAYQAPGATEAKNVLPLTDRSYAPLSDLTSVSSAIPSKPIGAGSFQNSDGVVSSFAGTDTNLYKLNVTAFDEVSKSTDAYNVPQEDNVNFVQYGERVVAALGQNDPLQSFIMGVDTEFSDLSSDAPRSRHVATINNFVMVGNTWDNIDGPVGNRVWWSAIDDPTDWPVIGSSDAAQKQSDRQDLPSGGWVQKITGAVGGADGAVFMEKSIYRIQYEGAPLVFSFTEVERDRGTPAKNSVVNIGPFAAFLAEDGFYIFDGTKSTPIGNQKVDKYFFNDLDQSYFYRVYGAADPINKIVFWAYPGSGHNIDGMPNKLIMYNWELGQWSYGFENIEYLFRDLTVGYTLDQLDVFGTMETLPFSLDSRVWAGGRLALSGFTSDFELGRFAGNTKAAKMTTQEFGGMELFKDPSQRMYIDALRPYVDGGTYTATLKFRESPSGTIETVGPNIVEPDGNAYFTQSCRYARAEVDISAGSDWSHAMGVDIIAEPDGAF